MQFPIYLDNHATTPVDPRVLDAMLPYFKEHFGNHASQTHAYGRKAADAVECARSQVADLIGASPKEILFTAGATESNNLAIKGVAKVYGEGRNHIITQATEHKCVLNACRALEKDGFEVTYLPVNEAGEISLRALEAAITPKTLLISIMAANNEVGTIHPISEIGKIAKDNQVFFHVDAAQGIGKFSIDVARDAIDLLSCSAHKIYGPKGVGALYVRRRVPRVRLEPLLHGGGQEENLRSGTVNVPGVVGLGKACEIARLEMAAEVAHLQGLRDRLYEGFTRELDEVYVNGGSKTRLPNNLNLSFLYADAERVLEHIAGEIAVSTGSACISAMSENSYVLRALGLSVERVSSSIRFGTGRFNTVEEIDYTIKKVVSAVKAVREHSPFYKMAKNN